MAASIRIQRAEALGNSTAVWGTIVLDSSYPTGGEAIAIADTTNDITLERIDVLFAQGAGYLGDWDEANQKLIMRYFDYDAGADGAAIQVPNTTDLSSVTVDFFAIGQ